MSFCEGQAELFDLESDPEELHDLSTDPTYLLIVQGFENQLGAMLDPSAVDPAPNKTRR